MHDFTAHRLCHTCLSVRGSTPRRPLQKTLGQGQKHTGTFFFFFHIGTLKASLRVESQGTRSV